MDILNAFLVLVVLLNWALGAWVITRDWRHLPHQCFAVFAASVGCWTLAILLFRITTGDALALLFLTGAYSAAVLIGASYWTFATVFPNRTTLRRGQMIVLGLPTLFFVALLLVPGFLVRQILPAAYGKAAVLGMPAYLLFAGVFLGFFGGGLWRIASQISTASGIVRVQLRYIFWGVLLPGIVGVICNLVFPSPFFGNFHWIWAGPLCSVIMVAAVATAIVSITCCISK